MAKNHNPKNTFGTSENRSKDLFGAPGPRDKKAANTYGAPANSQSRTRGTFGNTSRKDSGR